MSSDEKPVPEDPKDEFDRAAHSHEDADEGKTTAAHDVEPAAPPEQDPKIAFDKAAPAADTDDALSEEHYVGGGDVKPDESEEDIAARQEKGRAAREALGEDEAQQEAEQNNKHKEKENWFTWYHRRFKWGIADHDQGEDGRGFMTINPKGPLDKRSGTRSLTDKQLAAIILKMTLEKGYHTLYFYRGRNIDQALTQRANQMISQMSHPGDPDKKIPPGKLAGFQASASNSRMPGPEPWLGFIARAMSQYSKGSEARAADKAVQKTAKLAAKCDNA